MTTKKASGESRSGKKAAKAGKRDKVKNMYAKREPEGSSKGGQFKEMDAIGPSLKADRRQKAKRTVRPGYGDQGDQPTASKKSGAKKSSEASQKSGAKRSSAKKR